MAAAAERYALSGHDAVGVSRVRSSSHTPIVPSGRSNTPKQRGARNGPSKWATKPEEYANASRFQYYQWLSSVPDCQLGWPPAWWLRTLSTSDQSSPANLQIPTVADATA